MSKTKTAGKTTKSKKQPRAKLADAAPFSLKEMEVLLNELLSRPYSAAPPRNSYRQGYFRRPESWERYTARRRWGVAPGVEWFTEENCPATTKEGKRQGV